MKKFVMIGLFIVLAASSSFSYNYKLYKKWNQDNNQFEEEFKKGREKTIKSYHKVYFKYSKISKVETFIDGVLSFIKIYHYDSYGKLLYQKHYYQKKLIGWWYYKYNNRRKPLKAIYQNAAGTVLKFYEYQYNQKGHLLSEKYIIGRNKVVYEKKYSLNKDGLPEKREHLKYVNGKPIRERVRYYYNENKQKIGEEVYYNNELIRFQTYCYDKKSRKLLYQQHFNNKGVKDFWNIHYYQHYKNHQFSLHIDLEHYQEYSLYYKTFFQEDRIVKAEEYRHNSLRSIIYFNDKGQNIKQKFYTKDKETHQLITFYNKSDKKVKEERYSDTSPHGYWLHFNSVGDIVRWDFFWHGKQLLAAIIQYNSQRVITRETCWYLEGRIWKKAVVKYFQAWDYISNKLINPLSDEQIENSKVYYAEYLDAKSSKTIFRELYQNEELKRYYINLQDEYKLNILEFEKETLLGKYHYSLNSDGQFIEGNYVFKGLLDRAWIYFYDSSNKYNNKVEVYAGNKLATVLYYNPQGDKIKEEQYFQGQLHGKTFHYEMGLIAKTEIYVKGELQDYRKFSYNSSGVKVTEEVHNVSSKNTEIFTYHPNGKLHKTERFANNQPSGNWYIYTKFGEIAEKKEYIDGKLVNLWKYFYDNKYKQTKVERYDGNGKLLQILSQH